MTEAKKNNSKGQTKAGMLEKGSRNSAGKGKAKSEKDPENTPKVSKNEATEHNDDRPLH